MAGKCGRYKTGVFFYVLYSARKQDPEKPTMTRTHSNGIRPVRCSFDKFRYKSTERKKLGKYLMNTTVSAYRRALYTVRNDEEEERRFEDCHKST